MILIVEDDPQVARLISLVLQRNGYKGEVVEDGGVALERIRAANPQMVFADLHVKGMNGEALCTLVKKEPITSGIPFVILSGDRDIAEKARACGADEYLGKPFEFDELIRLVKRYVHNENS
ncbi:MAG TPA: response regulator [Thermoanaerobaculia bacterium]|nr:response regulator [Thermoanaerobaculia bacterium]